MILTEKQQKGLDLAVARYNEHKAYTCIAGYAGSGKAQPVDTIIPTPNGNIELGQLKIGDYVFDRLGKPTKILNIYPQGTKEKYKIILSDGRETICASDHLWSYYTNSGKLVSKTAQEMLDSGLRKRNGFKYKIPTSEPVQYSTKQYEIDPYLMGVFIGDGCCKQRYLTISSETDEIPNLIGEIIDAKPIRGTEKNYSWTFEWNNKAETINWVCGNNGQRVAKRKKPKTLDYFAKYKDYLMQYAYEKDIPPEYKFGDIDQRLSLIQGLMDTDGTINSVDNHRYNMRFTSTSLKLIKSLQEILFSLGYSSTIHIDKREKKYTNKICYNLGINIPNEEKHKFFRLKRKKDIALEAQKYPKQKDYSRISIVDIVPLKEKTEMICIYVDNPEHLYLTNDYIVTHNTTLVKFIIKALGVPNSQVAYVAYTGKAAAVLQAKGNPNATTVHKLIYHAYPTKTGKYKFRPKLTLDDAYKVLVVDEVSMLPKSMWDLLLSYKVYVLACGDPGQLPSLFKNERNDILDHPHIFLDEIMRQAQDSEIIRLSMHVREGKPISTFDCKNEQVQIVHRNEMQSGMYTWADQVICATNKTRNFINKLVREYKGLDPNKPCVGDRIIGLHNDWDTLSDNGEWALTNGTIGTILGYEVENQWVTPRLKLPIKDIDIAYTDFELDDGSVFSEIPIDYQGLATGELVLDDLARYRMANWEQSNLYPPHDFVYAYAITCWKAQGSEYNKVLLIEEDHPFDKLEHIQYLYTGITRAKDKLVVVIKD